MPTTFYLIRHGAYTLLGRVLVGCRLDVPLDGAGRRQAMALARRFSRERLDAIQSSPRERTLQTATPVAERLGIPIEIEPALDEIDCGDWSGRRFDELSLDPSWRFWNSSRSKARAPGGESMADVQQRIVAHLERVHSARRGARVLIVSHCDVIRAAMLHYLGLSLDCYAEIAIDPAAVSTMVIGDGGGRIVALNEAVTA